jgi:hypothetical protein
MNPLERHIRQTQASETMLRTFRLLSQACRDAPVKTMHDHAAVAFGCAMHLALHLENIDDSGASLRVLHEALDDAFRKGLERRREETKRQEP